MHARFQRIWVCNWGVLISVVNFSESCLVSQRVFWQKWKLDPCSFKCIQTWWNLRTVFYVVCIHTIPSILWSGSSLCCGVYDCHLHVIFCFPSIIQNAGISVVILQFQEVIHKLEPAKQSCAVTPACSAMAFEILSLTLLWTLGVGCCQTWRYWLENSMEGQMNHKYSHVKLPFSRTFIKVSLPSP